MRFAFAALWLCAIPFHAFAALFAKLASMPSNAQIGVPRGTRPPTCPFCGGKGTIEFFQCEMAGVCDCPAAYGHCLCLTMCDGSGRACPVCSGTLVVPASTIRSQLAEGCWIAPLNDYAKAGKWN